MATTDIATPFFMTEEVQALAKTTADEIVRSGASDSMSPAVKEFVTILNTLSQGKEVLVFPIPSELTLKDAADFLAMPVACLEELLGNGVLEYRTDGKQRFVLRDSLLAYDRRLKKGQAAMDEIVRLSEEMGLYDD